MKGWLSGNPGYRHPFLARSSCKTPSATAVEPVPAVQERVSSWHAYVKSRARARWWGNNVSHANNKTKRRFLPNLQYRRFWVETENRWVRLRVSSAALRLIDKNGIDAVLADLRARGQA